MAWDDEFKAGDRRAARRQKETPPAIAARYDRKSGRIVVNLSSGVDLMFPPSCAQRLEHATPAQLSAIEISPSGLGIHFPKLGADLYLPALLEGVLGTRKWMAAKLGSVGGLQTSPSKKRAARSNGKVGGRPRKTVG